MAIVQCPECEKSVSDQAKVCPNCGYPLEKGKIYRIWLTSADSENEELVKLIQSIKGVDYTEAQKFIKTLPQTLQTNLSEDVAKKYCNEIMELGGFAEVLEDSVALRDKKYYSIRVISGSTNNQRLVKFISLTKGISFMEAKDLLNKSPFIFANNLCREVADNYCYRIISMGGFAEIIEQDKYDNLLYSPIKIGVWSEEPKKSVGCLAIAGGIILAVIVLSLL